MKTARTYKRGCLVSLLIFVGFVFSLSVVEPTTVALRERAAIGRVFRHAKSVELVHYAPGLGSPEDRIVYNRKTLGPSEFHQFLDAVPWTLDLGFWGVEDACLFDPHHKLIITDADGYKTTIRICFECDHIRINDGPIIPTPFTWRGRLRDFFDTEGMTDKSAPEYWHDGVVKFITPITDTNHAPGN